MLKSIVEGVSFRGIGFTRRECLTSEVRHKLKKEIKGAFRKTIGNMEMVGDRKK